MQNFTGWYWANLESLQRKRFRKLFHWSEITCQKIGTCFPRLFSWEEEKLCVGKFLNLVGFVLSTFVIDDFAQQSTRRFCFEAGIIRLTAWNREKIDLTFSFALFFKPEKGLFIVSQGLNELFVDPVHHAWSNIENSTCRSHYSRICHLPPNTCDINRTK